MAEATRDELLGLAHTYLDILATGAVDRAGEIFAPDLVWHFGAVSTSTGVDGWQAMVGT